MNSINDKSTSEVMNNLFSDCEKRGSKYNKNEIKSFKLLLNTNYEITTNAIICNTGVPYKIDDNCYALPISVI